MQKERSHIHENKNLEIKAIGTAQDATDAFEYFMKGFEAYKQENNERLQKVEKGQSLDVVTAEKLDRLDRFMDEQKHKLDQLILKQARPALGDRSEHSLVSIEHKGAFETYVRRGDEQAIRNIETKAHSYGSAPDGGYLVPPEVEHEIGKRLFQMSPIRSLASVRQVTGAILKKPFSVKGPAVGWVGETDVRPETSSGTLSELQFPTMELYAMPAATASLLDDAAIDVERWITSEIEIAFAEQEGIAFVHGDGINKPRGFLHYESIAEEHWRWGKLGHVKTGNAAALPIQDASDVLIELIYALKPGYRRNASWVMNRKTQATLRKLKDNDGHYLWQPPVAVGKKASLMGFDLVEAEEMPDIADGMPSIAFGDFARGYLVVDRVGVRVLRDPYSAKPYVLFYTTKRVGGGIQDFDAIKLLKFSA